MSNRLKVKNSKKSSARMIATPTGPGHHWDKLTPEERSAIGQKAAETRRRNQANRSDAVGKLVTNMSPQKEVQGYVSLLESIAAGATAAADLLKAQLRGE